MLATKASAWKSPRAHIFISSTNPTIMSLDEALKAVPLQHKQQVREFYDAILDFSTTVYSEYFESCGLYLVGSTLQKVDSHDIDITLVGLDFRALYSYDRCYLGDTDALIESKRLVPLDTAKNSNQVIVVHEGEKYCVDFDTPTPRHHITVSPFTQGLIAHLDNKLGYHHDAIIDADTNPLNGYNHEDAYFGGSRVNYGMIDFFLHGENLHVSQWKTEQQEKKLSFIALKEWDKLDDRYRPRLTNKPLP